LRQTLDASRAPHFGAARAVLFPIVAFTIALGFTLSGCNGSNSTSSSSTAEKAQVRFAEGSPSLITIINGVPQQLSGAYLSVNGATVALSFPYGAITPFVPMSAGTLALTALDVRGDALGPIKTTTPLTAGKSYTVILVGTYPKYSALVYEEPTASSTASVSLYAASPSHASADFGSFAVSTHANFRKLGSARYGSVVTAALAKSVNDFGGYVGNGTQALPNGTVALSSINTLDVTNSLPFNNATRLSLFLFDANGSSGPVFGSLDQ
jgi:hypothetical protein